MAENSKFQITVLSKENVEQLIKLEDAAYENLSEHERKYTAKTTRETIERLVCGACGAIFGIINTETGELMASSAVVLPAAGIAVAGLKHFSF